MKTASSNRKRLALCVALSALALFTTSLMAQTCQTSPELDDATRNAINSAAQRYFDMAARGDAASLRQNSIPALASDFSGVEATLKARQQDLAGSQGTVKSTFLLDATSATDPHEEFYCGVFGKNGQTANSAAFYLDNLPPAKYAAVLLDANSAKGRTMFSEILQQTGTDWKLGGLYVKAASVGGHDSEWFLNRARQYKTQGQLHNAWLYFLEGRSLASPLSFMSTLASDRLYDESQTMTPPDMPAGGKTIDLPTPTGTYKMTAVFPEVVGNDLDLIVRYQSANASNTNQAYADNIAIMKVLVMKYPELRDAFAGVVARGVDATGRDYGTLLAMKDIK